MTSRARTLATTRGLDGKRAPLTAIGVPNPPCNRSEFGVPSERRDSEEMHGRRAIAPWVRGGSLARIPAARSRSSMSADLDSDDLNLDTDPDVESARRRLLGQDPRHDPPLRAPRHRHDAALNQRLRDEGGRIESCGYSWDPDPESDLVIVEFPEE